MQFVGDEVFSVFAAPLPVDAHCRATLAVARRVVDDRDDLVAALRADDLPPIEFGIGVHTGEVVAAHVGTAVRTQYSVMGDTVNVTSRLCSLAGAGQIVATEAIVAQGTANDFTPAGTYALKGVDAPVLLMRYGREIPLRGEPIAEVPT
jgi:class 3 adenylate cyclase